MRQALTTLNELIAQLEQLRHEHGGDAPVFSDGPGMLLPALPITGLDWDEELQAVVICNEPEEPDPSLN